MLLIKTEVNSSVKDEIDCAELLIWFQQEIENIIWIGNTQQHPNCNRATIRLDMQVHDFGCPAKKRMEKMEEMAVMEKKNPEYRPVSGLWVF